MDIYVARQPIFDARHRVTAFELLYRRDGHAMDAGPGPMAAMSASVMVDGLLGMGLEELTGGKPAYINFTRESVLLGAADVLDPSSVVIELHESVEPDEDVLDACRDLVDRGFRLAMDDFVLHPRYAPLLELAEIVKIDVLDTPLEVIDDWVEELAPFNITLLAEKVEHETVHKDCLALGFELFQGFHFLRPETLTGRDLSTQSISIIRLLNLLRDLDASDRAIQETFRSDPTLSFKLLRMVNSATLGGRGIASIGHALRILGRDSLYRWLSILLLLEGRGRSEVTLEIVKSSLLRGRMCELLGDFSRSRLGGDVPGSGVLFMVGLFSHLDTLFEAPMAGILARIDVAGDVTEALLSRGGMAGTILATAEAYESGSWAEAEEAVKDRLATSPAILPDLYLSSLEWAGTRVGLHLG